MARATIYPPADTSAQWYGQGNATVTPTAMLWHTTETAGGWPAYSGGSMAPNLTYEPWLHSWRQHFPINGTARALANGSDGYQTNRMGVVQVEVSCYSDPSYASKYGHGVHDLDDQAFADLGAFAQFLADEWGIPLTLCDMPFVPVGAKTTRFTETAFPPFYGHCGHQHAPNNDHADPGDLDVGRIIGGSRDITPVPPRWKDDLMRLIQADGKGVALIGPAYVHGVGSTDELNLWVRLYGDPEVVNAYEFDELVQWTAQNQATG